MHRYVVRCGLSAAVLFGSLVVRASAQMPIAAAIPAAAADSSAQHDQMQMPMNGGQSWTFMQDGALFATFNHQGGPRGGDEFVAPNWWMGMASRPFGASTLRLDAMLSLDPATVGKSGYREIFQAGEALNGRPLIDRQHPHDFFMQLAAVWRTPLTDTTGLTLAGGPVGEPALGPVAFMHRASAMDNPTAPLSHHTFDSTHISYGVVTAALDHGPFVVEASVFNGREPDENRWDFDFGALDSVSARVWYKPAPEWEFQVSTGHLVDPEALDPGNVQRTTVSGSYLKRNGSRLLAVAAGYGINALHGDDRQAAFAEATVRSGMTSFFGRAELLQVETDLLLTDAVPSNGQLAAKSAVGAFTAGAVRDVIHWRGLQAGIGGTAELYAVPDALQRTHGTHPVTVQLFLRVRPADSNGHMWNMHMAEPIGMNGTTHPMD